MMLSSWLSEPLPEFTLFSAQLADILRIKLTVLSH